MSHDNIEFIKQSLPDRLIRMSIISPHSYYRLATVPGEVASYGYAVLPVELLAAEQSVARYDPSAAVDLNKSLCRNLLADFTFTSADAYWAFPQKFHFLYEQQLQRIRNLLSDKPDSYFTLENDSFRKDLAILCHRLIPCGPEPTLQGWLTPSR